MKNVFSYNTDIHKNAYMNWRTDSHQPIHNLNTLAKGYFENVILSIKDCLDDNSDKKADIFIFPILFSLNHGIELYTKSLCWSVNILLNNTSKFDTNHNIKGLWQTAKDKLYEFGFGYGREESEFIRMTTVLEAYIDEIYHKIMTDNFETAHKNIDFSRYPFGKSNQSHFYITTYDNVVVDLENLLNVVKDIYECLNRLTDTYYDLACRKWDMEAEQ